MPPKMQSYKLLCSGGLNSNENHLALAEQSPGAATRLINYEPSMYGGYRRIEGYEYYSDDYPEVGAGSCEGKVLGVFMFRNDGGNPYPIAARKDTGANTYSFWKFTAGVGWSQMTTPALTYDDGSNEVHRIRHVQFDFGAGGMLAVADGINAAMVFDGTTWSALAGDQMITAPAVVDVFENHLFLSGDSVDRSVVAHSAPNDPIKWNAADGAGQLPVGFPVVQIKPFRRNLFVFGGTAIKKITPDVSAGFVIEQVTSNVGCVARDSVLEIGGDLIFLAPDGIRPVAGTSRIGDVELETVSKSIQGRIREVVSTGDLDELCGVVIRGKSQFRYFLDDATVAAPSSQGILGGLTTMQDSLGWEFSNLRGFKVACVSSEYIGSAEYILHGDYDGNVYQQESGTTFAGDDIVAIYSTPFLDFGETEFKKNMHKLNVFLRSEGPFDLNISLDFDWNDPDTARPAAYSESSSGTPLVWGGRNLTYGDTTLQYGGNSKPVMTTDIQGSGYSVRINLVTVGDYEPHSIQGMVLEFLVAGR